jgi:hypothetical protein
MQKHHCALVKMQGDKPKDNDLSPALFKAY